MSVINQMLKDLDQRKAIDARLLRQPVIARPGKQLGLWWLLLIPVLWLGVEMGQRWQTPPSQSDVAASVAAPARQGQPVSDTANVQQVNASQPIAQEAETQEALIQQAATQGTGTKPLPAKPLKTAQVPSAQTVRQDGAQQVTTADTVPIRNVPQAAENIAPEDSRKPATAADTAVVTASLNAATTAQTEFTVQADLPTAASEEQLIAAGNQSPASDAVEVFGLTAAEPALVPAQSDATASIAAVKPQMTVTPVDAKAAGPQHWRMVAQQALAAGHPAEAEAAWLQLARQAAHRTEAYEQLAQLYLQQQDSFRLAALLQQAQQQQIDSQSLQWARIRHLAATQQWQVLLDNLTPAVQQAYALQILPLEAHAALQTNQTERARLAYQRWGQLAPQDSRPWLGLGMLHDQRSEWAQAQQAYQQALQLGGLSDASRVFIQQRLAVANGQ